MNGGELVAQVLKKQGVNFLFTLSGGHIAPIIVGAKNQGLRVIDVRQESTAVYAADAISRLTGVPGVAAVTAGPGITNSITAIKNAQMSESPLILLGGATATILKGRGSLQEMDQIKLCKSIVKWAASVKKFSDIPNILEKAFHIAKSGVPGPVFVEFPIDILYNEKLVKEWYGIQFKDSKPKNITDRVIKWYLQRHVKKLFADSKKSKVISVREENNQPQIEQKSIEKVISYMNEAESPVLIIGTQAVLMKKNINELADAVKILGIPVYLTSMARGLLGGDYSLNFRHSRTKALKEADLVILAGVTIDFRLNYGRIINKKTTIISINQSHKILKKNRRPTMGIKTNPANFLIVLSKEKPNAKNNWKDWLKKLKTREHERDEEIKIISEIKTEYINPLFLCKKLNDSIAPNSIIIGDGGDFIATASYIVKPRIPLSWFDPGPFGTLGVGAGFALAAKLVHPEAEVWLLYGDGTAGYSIIEFDTFVRHKIPIIGIVGNDAGWTQCEREQVEFLNDNVGTNLNYSGYHLVAKGFRAKGLLLDNSGDIEATLQKAKIHANKGHPVVINALIGKTDFRKGSISF